MQMADKTINSLFYYILNFTMQQSVYQIQNKSQYKHQGVNRSKKQQQQQHLHLLSLGMF